MSKVYLCGHTGSMNRGCEAIIRSTAAVLRNANCEEIVSMTVREQDDRKVRLNEVVELMPYPKKMLHIRAVGYLRRKLLQDGEWGARYSYFQLFEKLDKADILFNVGGDTYCYDRPYLSYALNELAEEKGIPNVFWGCSVDERILADKKMQEDVNRYSYVVVRETLSYELMRQVLADQKKLLLACDPAFQLPVEPTTLPENFLVGNTLGLNVFPLDNRPMAMENIVYFLDQVLSQTDMNICLVPHVYNAETRTVDLEILGTLYNRYAHSGRVALVQQHLSCTQLKYIISQCRFFVGARTHSMIAAYSTGVPALALSYSIKSRGIAKDILGEESYALPWHAMKSEDTLWNVFEEKILNKETQIRHRYQDFLPDYRQSILDVCKLIIKELGVECE